MITHMGGNAAKMRRHLHLIRVFKEIWDLDCGSAWYRVSGIVIWFGTAIMGIGILSQWKEALPRK